MILKTIPGTQRSLSSSKTVWSRLIIKRSSYTITESNLSPRLVLFSCNLRFSKRPSVRVLCGRPLTLIPSVPSLDYYIRSDSNGDPFDPELGWSLPTL